MSEENKIEGTETTETENKDQGQPEVTPSDLKSITEKEVLTTEEFNKFKAHITKVMSNFDRVNNDKIKLENENKKLKEANLTEKQIKELREQEFAQTLKEKEAAIIAKELAFEKTKYVSESKIDIEFIDLLTAADTLDDFKEKSEKLKVLIKREAEKIVNEKMLKANPNIASSAKQNTGELFTAQELQDLPRKNGIEWTKTNMEKIERSLKALSKK